MNTKSKLILFVAVLASLLEIVDSSIVNVAIPSMMGNLGATLEDISMVVTGYAIANAIVLPLSAWLSERIGRRTYYLGCIFIFIVTSVACGLAPNLTALIIFRIFQGLAGGALLPTSQSLIYEQFPKEKAGTAGAIFGMSVMIGPALGPTLGGYLTDQFGWRSIFNVNLPVGILALVIGAAVIFDREDEPTTPNGAANAEPAPLMKNAAKEAKQKSPIDVFGLVLLTLGIGCLQFVLERGETDDWFSSGPIIVNSVLAAVCIPTFIWWELRVAYPIMNIRLFKDAIVRNGVMLMTMLGFFLYAVVFILPVFVTNMFHYDATQVGMLFIPGSILTAMIMPFVGKAMSKMDPRILIGIGLVAIEVFLFALTNFTPQTSRETVINVLYIRGFAMAFMFVPINSSILSQFKGAELGQVSGLMNLSRQIGGSMGIALVSTLLTVNSKQNNLDIGRHISMLDPATQRYVQTMQAGGTNHLSKLIGSASPSEVAVGSLYGRMAKQSFMLSFVQLMWLVGFIFLLAFIPMFMLRLRSKAKAVDSH